MSYQIYSPIKYIILGVIDLWTVYIHTNLINGKKYVGITSNPVKKRWRNGYGYSENLPIGRAIRKYGWENFDHEIIADNLDEDDAKKDGARINKIL